jgi:uncharacterized protein involved in outer membrane biogenesis
MTDIIRHSARRLRLLVVGVPFLVTAGVVVFLVVAYTLAGFFLAPRLIRTYVPRYVQEQLKRHAEIGEVRVNPLLFKLEITRFRLQEADGRPLMGFDRLFVDFELSSLFRRAWTFAAIELDAPRLDVVLTRDGRLNLAELLDAFPPSEPAPAATTPRRVLLEHAAIRRGVLSFTDLSGRAPQTATVEPIDVELRNITTLPGRRGPYAITASLIGGGDVGWEGEVSLVPLGSTGHLGLSGFPLATAWRFLQDNVALAEPGGRVDAQLRYQFAYRDGAASLNVDGVDVTVAGLALTQRGEPSPLLALEQIRLAGVRGDLISRELTIPEISVSRGRLGATMARDGTVNWQRLLVSAPPAAAAPAVGGAGSPPAAAGDGRPWRVAVEKVRVEDVALSFADQSRAAPLQVDVAGVTLDLSARLESGAAGLAGAVENLGLKLARITVREAAAKAPVVSLDQVSLEGGRVDMAKQQVALSRVAVTGGTTTVVRAADGSVPLVTMLGPADQGAAVRPPAKPAAARPAPTPAAARPAPTPAATPWTVAVGKVELTDHRLAIADRSVTPAVELEINGIKLSARDLRSDGKKPFPFDASFRVKQGGRFTATGRAAPDGQSAEVTLTVAELALLPTQPYIARTAAVELRSGAVSTTGRLTYRAGRDRAVVTYSGSADVDRLNVVEAGNGDPVVSWNSLHADGLRFRLAPDGLEIAELRLAGLDGKLVIFQDKTLSVAKLMKSPGEPAVEPATNAPAAAPGRDAPSAPAAPPGSAAAGAPETTTESEAAPAFPVRVERVRIDEGSMHFADLSLVLPFATRVHTLNGVVLGLGSDRDSRATVKLDGRVDEFGSVKVDGALSSFAPKTFTDITVVFRNVPMTTLTPYSATFAGRRIQAGTLDLDLEYKIDRGALVGENKVVLQRLQLGERVESPGAMRLPLDLAIAILSDSEGKIDIALPVRGNVNSPEFSYGHLIWQAIVTVVTKIVTSPFRALAGLFGGESESLQSVAFEAGSDVVPPPERQKLQRVVQVLGKRPQLKLTVHGGYESKADGEALRSLHVRQDLARRLEVKLKPGEDPGPVAFDHAKTQRSLEAMLTERDGPKALEEFQASQEKASGKKVQRVNPVLGLVGRGSSDLAFYEALFRRLVETSPLPESELTALGQRRAEAVARTLKESAAAAAARVEVGNPEAATRAERSAVPTRLELGAAGS